MASFISRKSRRNSDSLFRRIEYRAIGSAAEARIIKILQAIINSRSVIPASDLFRALLRSVRFMVVRFAFLEFDEPPEKFRNDYCFTLIVASPVTSANGF